MLLISHVHVFVADVIKSFDTLTRRFWIGFLVALGYLLGSAMPFFSTMRMCVFVF